MPMPIPDLSLVPTKDLVDAACTRFDHAVFHGIINRNSPTPDEDGQQIFAIRRVGDPLKCIGMAVAIERFILDDLNARTEESDGSAL